MFAAALLGVDNLRLNNAEDEGAVSVLSLQPETMGMCSRNCSVLLFRLWVLKGCLGVAAELHRDSQDGSALCKTLVVAHF